MKYNVGDYVLYRVDEEDAPRKIVGLWHNEYLVNIEEMTDSFLDYNTFSSHRNAIGVIKFNGLAFIVRENELTPAFKDIKDTKIARKMNKEYEVLDNGKLRVML